MLHIICVLFCVLQVEIDNVVPVEELLEVWQLGGGPQELRGWATLLTAGARAPPLPPTRLQGTYAQQAYLLNSCFVSVIFLWIIFVCLQIALYRTCAANSWRC